jgi:anti-sigma regulatory factor (Ser/Thr protein kinase)
MTASGRAGARALVASLVRAVGEWSGALPQSDDLTLLALACEGSLEADPHPELVDLARTLGRAADEAELAASLEDASHLSLPADLERLHELRGWLDTAPVTADLPADARDLLESGVYEVMANLAEHAGAREDIDIWLVPAGAARLTAVLRDHCEPYDPGRTETVDLTTPEARSRGRGLGLPMLRILTDSRGYLQETAVGNLHLLRFDFEAVIHVKENCHV